MIRKLIAEVLGTFVLVFGGCGSAVFAAAFPGVGIGLLGVSLAFGLTVTAMAYLFGSLSGAHLNPAVTLGFWAAGRMPAAEVPGYVAAQFVGAVAGAGVLLLIAAGAAGGHDVGTLGLGQTAYDPAQWNVLSVVAVEAIATLAFIAVILAVTAPGRNLSHGGLIIGLTLAILHLMFVPVSGNSLNPARSLGPALFTGGAALAQLWLYLIVPSAAGLLAGWLTRRFGPAA